MKESEGFTLIELLVVVAIIGVLVTVSIVSINIARARARDARRSADIKQVRTALEFYYHAQNKYPDTDLITTNGILDKNKSVSDSDYVYMKSLPESPKPASAVCTDEQNVYTYESNSDDDYALTYCTGEITGVVSAGVKIATPSGIEAVVVEPDLPDTVISTCSQCTCVLTSLSCESIGESDGGTPECCPVGYSSCYPNSAPPPCSGCPVGALTVPACVIGQPCMPPPPGYCRCH